MGASILWQPVKGRVITLGPRSRFVNALGLDIGPRLLEADAGEFLRGLAAGEPAFKEAVSELLDAIETHGRVRVWAEY